MTSTGDGPRRAELVAALSLAIDLGLGQPMEHMLRSAVIATRIADRMRLTRPAGCRLLRQPGGLDRVPRGLP